jgi:membrane protease YdiL (CAAX protease family)
MLPMLLVVWGVVPFDWHIPVMMSVMLVIFYFVSKDKLTRQDLGMVMPSNYKDYIIYLIAILIGLVGILFFAYKLGYTPMPNWQNHPTFLYLFIPISVLQEFAYRSVLTKELDYIFDEPVQIILTNAGIFAILHIMYPDALAVLPLTFIGGIFLSTLWHIKPNFYLISFAHIVFNFTAVLYGFFDAS